LSADDDSEKFEVQLHEGTFKGHRIDPPSLDVHVSKNQLVEMYTQMTCDDSLADSADPRRQMRRMEMAADQLYKQKMIRGFCHLAIGQEAVAVGMESAMQPNDKLITAYRCHPFAVMRGGTIKGVIAELLGRVDGMSHGKGGSMHIFTKSFFGGNVRRRPPGPADRTGHRRRAGPDRRRRRVCAAVHGRGQ